MILIKPAFIIVKDKVYSMWGFTSIEEAKMAVLFSGETLTVAGGYLPGKQDRLSLPG